MRLFQQISALLFPPKCVLCRRILEKEETDLCHSCRIHTQEFPEPKKKPAFLEKWSALWYYEGNVRGSILRYKFHNARSYAGSYGRLLAMKLTKDMPEGFDILTWVPISARRRKKRGYDQVELLARAVGQELEAEPTATLRKIRDNPPQSGITGHAQRKANVLGVYQAVDAQGFQGKRVLLLDDILTTGATVSECARVLLTAGAAEVSCAVLAAAPHHDKKQ